MAQQKTSRKCEGLCQKIQNAASSFRTIRRQPPPPHPPSNEKTVRISASSQTKPVRVVSKTIPIESEPHFSAQSKKLITLSPVAGKENSIVKPVQEFAADREIMIVRSQNFAKSVSMKDEHKFSDYITKVKNRLTKTASNIGGGGSGGSGGGGGGASPRKDSFNDNVTKYINRAKIKIRTTTSLGEEKKPLFQVIKDKE